jgi:thiol:disulfide interchange protein
MARNPVVDAFLSGVLAVLVAAPCTAPFMGASVGVAFTLPTWQGLLIFLSLGTGLALPFTMSAWLPATAAWLPKPGAWMQVLRQTLAFPMLLTVVWLLWVFSKQAGEEGAALLLAALVLAGGMVWSLGLAKPAGQWVRAVFIACLCAVLWLASPVWRNAPAPEAKTMADGAWQAWSTERVNAALQQKQAPGVKGICGSQRVVVASGLDASGPGNQSGLGRLGSQRGAGVCAACAGQAATSVVGVTYPGRCAQGIGRFAGKIGVRF